MTEERRILAKNRKARHTYHLLDRETAGIELLGTEVKAIRAGKMGVELLPVSKDAWRGLYRVEDLARIYVMVGEYDAAIDQLEFLLSRPSNLSVALLRLDPTWDPVRDHPRFQRLLEGRQ